MTSLAENAASSLKPKLQLYLIQKIKSLNSSSDSDLTLRNVFRFVCLIENILIEDDADDNKPSTRNSKLRVSVLDEFKANFFNHSRPEIKNEFKRSFYSICLNELLASLGTLLSIDTTAEEISLADVKNALLGIISSANYSDSFRVIYEFCVELKPSQHKDFCLYLMKFFLSKHLLKELFLEQSYMSRSCLIEDTLTQKLFNLPDKLANVYNKNLK